MHKRKLWVVKRFWHNLKIFKIGVNNWYCIWKYLKPRWMAYNSHKRLKIWSWALWKKELCMWYVDDFCFSSLYINWCELNNTTRWVWKILGILDEGHSVREEFGIAKSITEWLGKIFYEAGIGNRRCSSGWPTQTVANKHRSFGHHLTVKKNRQICVVKLPQEVQTLTGARISYPTVTRRLNRVILYTQWPNRCVPLSLLCKRWDMSSVVNTSTGLISRGKCVVHTWK